MKKLILTIDYELFLGEKTGTVRKCMIEPTEKLSLILEKNDSKMTVFWDVLHYYRLLELEKDYSVLMKRRILIEEQILDLVKRGHDIQLHLHPHWLDANYENSKWNFKYDRFKLHTLSNEKRKNDINTITGCIAITKKLIEDLIRKEMPNYKVTTFRAGGYLIEPFEILRDALVENGIKIDSSVCPDLFNDHGIFSFDFRNYPNELKYNFEYSLKNNLKTGGFTEIPITTLRVPTFYNIIFKFIRKIKYSNLENERQGTGVGNIRDDTDETENGTEENSGIGEYFKPLKINYFKRLLSLRHPSIEQLTTDSNFKEKYSYLFRKAPQYATMILHPKLLNKHTLSVLDNYVSANKIRFISIQDFLT